MSSASSSAADAGCAKKTKTPKPCGEHLLLREQSGCAMEVGIDEVARGCLLGRVYAGAVWWGDAPLPQPMPKGIVIRDSKAMSAKQRERAAVWIQAHARACAVSFRTEAFVDEHNILVAAQSAMHGAVHELVRTAGREPDHLLVDGDRFRPLLLSNGAVPHTCKPRADDTYISVACASILAKVAHDHYIRDLCATYPALQERYGLLSNMGYGSALHRAGIRDCGVSQFHRRTFGCCVAAPLQPVLPQKEEEGSDGDRDVARAE